LNIIRVESTRLVANLDAIVQVLLKRGHIQDLILDGLCAVNDKLDGRFLSLDLKKRWR
jgi:hypothetical protein